MAKICIIGMWHQGLILSACFSAAGNDVIGICSNDLAENLNKGQLPIYEPGLFELIEKNYKAERLYFSSNYSDGLDGAELVFLSLDTPLLHGDKSNLDELYKLAIDIGKKTKQDYILCITSQVPPGTTEILADIVREYSKNKFTGKVAYIPEFLRLGNAINSFWEAERIVIGCDDSKTTDTLQKFYRDVYGDDEHDEPVILLTNIRSAEMTKLATNAFLAASLSFINEIANLCETCGADIKEVSKLLREDKRIGPFAFINAGLGYSGGTIGRDVVSLRTMAEEYKIKVPLLDAVDYSNWIRPGIITDKLSKSFNTPYGVDPFSEKTVGIIGLTYKANTSTMRGAVSVRIIENLVNRGVKVKVLDPLANLKEFYFPKEAVVCDTFSELAKDCDALVLLTEYSGLESLNFGSFLPSMKGNIFLDTKNYLNKQMMESYGFKYIGVGR